MLNKKAEILSFQQLIQDLEHIELDQLQCDIPENVDAELAHMKGNLAAVLAFLGHCGRPDAAADPQLCAAISTVRRECMSLNLTIFELRVLHFFRLNRIADSRYAALAAAQYEKLTMAVCQLCQISAPQLAEQLGSAL
jgi:hypothetical protein